MATRFYLPSTISAPRAVTFSASWNESTFGSRTIAAASNNQSLPQSTITINANNGFYLDGGIAFIQTSNGTQTVSYTAAPVAPGNTITGCTGGTGTMFTGDHAFGGAFSRRMSTVKQNSPMTNFSTTRNNGAVNPDNVLTIQYISDPLRAQTISGTVDGYIQCLESASTNHANAQITIRVLESDFVTVRGTLLATDAGGAVSDEFSNTTLTNRAFPVGLINNTLTSVTVQDYDVIVIEIGAKYFSTTTSITHTLRLGDNTSLSDLNANETDTADGVPWIEFSQNLLFATASEKSNLQTSSGNSGTGNEKGANSSPSITQVDGVGFLPTGGRYSYSRFQSLTKDGYEHYPTHIEYSKQFGTEIYVGSMRFPEGQITYYKMVGFYTTGNVFESFVVLTTPAPSTTINPNTGHTLINTYVADVWLV